MKKKCFICKVNCYGYKCAKCNRLNKNSLAGNKSARKYVRNKRSDLNE